MPPEVPMSTDQTNALVVALIYERAGEPKFNGSRGVNYRTIQTLARRGLMVRDEHGNYHLTDAGRACARSLKRELSPT